MVSEIGTLQSIGATPAIGVPAGQRTGLRVATNAELPLRPVSVALATVYLVVAPHQGRTIHPALMAVGGTIRDKQEEQCL